MTDPTEDIRKQMIAEINAAPGSREYLEPKHGQVWNTRQLSEDFEVIGLQPRSSSSARKSDGQKGSLCSRHAPVLLRLRAAPPVTPRQGWAGRLPRPFKQVESVTHQPGRSPDQPQLVCPTW